MSSNHPSDKDHTGSKHQVASIKLASKDADHRSANQVDPGPGDPNAAPSSMPMPVDIPDAPTSSQLVVKSTSHHSVPSAEPTGSTAPTDAPKTHQSSAHSISKMSGQHSKSGLPPPSDAAASPSESPASTEPNSSPASTPRSMHSSTSPSPAESSQVPESKPPSSMVKSKTPTDGASEAKPDGGVSGAEGASSPARPDDSAADEGASSPSPSPSTSPSDKRSKQSHAGFTSKKATATGKKATKFRYHKRITVRTKGKTSPSHVLAKVNKKDHQAGITASTIDNLDPEEIMKRAGIPPNKKAHWRVRLRQTKRTTKGGKTVTQTKYAYRDSEGNKKVRTSASPFCKNCGKKLEECRCDTKSGGPSGAGGSGAGGGGTDGGSTSAN